ncbi:MAG: tRNA-dihydrouridine synthase family protein [Nanoarchaeota archaeon]
MKSFSIGNVKLKNPLFLAPMVDVTDLPYRILCRRAGAGMAYTEMLNIGAILHENKKTQNMLKTCEEDKPSGVQITAPNVSDFKKVTPYLRKFDIVDINCGCPSSRIMDNASGSYLLKTPLKIAKYIRVLKDAGYTTTAKIRLGFKKNNVLRVAREIEKAGADALTLHARMAYDSYKIPADWKWIARVKKEIGIPIIGNGDVDSGKKAADMLDVADGAMIARAAIGDPQIFERIYYYMKTGKEQGRDFKKNMKYFADYLELAEKRDVVDIGRIKLIGSHFLRGFAGAAAKREAFMQVKTTDEAREFVKELVVDKTFKYAYTHGCVHDS